MRVGRLDVLWRGGWELRSPSGIFGTVARWAFTDLIPAFRWWIIGPVEVRWNISGQPTEGEILIEVVEG